MDGLDLSTLDVTSRADEGYWMPVRHPVTGAELPGARILVASFDGEHAAEARRKAQKRRLRRGEISPEDLERDAIDVTAAVIRGWEGISVKGEPLPFSESNKRLLLRQGWLKRQVDDAANTLGNYLPGGETPSSSTPASNGSSVSDQPVRA